jgi:hypothetical protein
MSERMTDDDLRDLLTQAALILLRAADRSWNNVTGEYRSWVDEGLLDEGRRRYHNEDGNGTAFAATIGTMRHEATYRIWATVDPWRVRMDLLQETPLAPEGKSPDVLICHGVTWWAQFGHNSVQTNAGLEHDTSLMRYGAGSLGILLRPATLRHAFNVSEATMTRAGGRRAIRLRGTPAEPLDRFFMKAAPLVVLGATEYAITVDAECGILLSAEAYIGERLARRQELVDMAIDVPSDDKIFTPRYGTAPPPWAD